MKVGLSGSAVLALAGVAVLGVLYMQRKAIVNAVSPLNHDNVFATGANDLGGAIFTDPEDPGKNADGSFNWGAWAFDVTHPGWMDEALGRGAAPLPDLSKTDDGHQYDAMGNVIY